MSIDLNLEINLYPVKLGIGFNNDLVDGVEELKKVGFIGRFLAHAKRGQILYFVKNCLVTCFDSEFVLSPETKAFKLDMVCGTSAFLWFENNVLARVTFQCIHSRYWAKEMCERFQAACQYRYGPPEVSPNGRLVIWKDSDSMVISELSISGKHWHANWLSL